MATLTGYITNNAPQPEADKNPVLAATAANAPQPGIDALQSLELSNRLHSSLDINKLLETYVTETNRIIPIDGLHFHNDDLNFQYKKGRMSRHSCNYRLLMGGQNLGEIHFFRGKRFAEEETVRLEYMLSSLLNPLHNSLMYQQAVNSALIDPLTQVNNRSTFEATLNREVSLAKRHHTSLAMLVVDIDHFKKINDDYGHLIGDCVLRDVAKCINSVIRNSDIVFRYGGEEFVILLSNTGQTGAMLLAERIRKAIAGFECSYGTSSTRVTASLGIACLKESEQPMALFSRADSALYKAKNQGRNQSAYSY